MSAVSELVGTAIYEALDTDAVTGIATGGVYQDKAPAGTKFPYVVFSRFAPGSVLYTFSSTAVHEDDEWLIKAFTEESPSGGYSPRKLGALILAACELALGSPLTRQGLTVDLAERVADIPPFQDPRDDRFVWVQGFRLRTVAR